VSKIIVESKSHTTGAELKRTEFEFEKDIHKIVINVDTGYLMRVGADVSLEVRTIHQTVVDFLKSDNQVLTLPEWCVLRTIDISDIREDMKNEGNKKQDNNIQP
jgi:hypothetical protein